MAGLGSLADPFFIGDYMLDSVHSNSQADAIRYIEELSLNAWPSHMIELYDGWLIRFSYNYTYRTNSVEQVGPSVIPTGEKIAYCEEVYRSFQSPCSFKINPLIDPSFDRILSERDYSIRHVTEVMEADLERMNLLQPSSADSVSSNG